VLNAAVGAVAIALCCAAPAQAIPRFATPSGSTSGECLTEATECTLAQAITVADSGDEIRMDPGTYTDAGGDGYELPVRLTLLGDPGARPLIKATGASDSAIELQAQDITLQHVALESTSTAVGVQTLSSIASGVTLTDVSITSASGCADISDASLQDVSATTTATNDQCLRLSGAGSLRRVTVNAPSTDQLALGAGFYNSEDVRVSTSGDGASFGPALYRRLRIDAGGIGLFIGSNTGTPAVTDSAIRGGTDAVLVKGLPLLDLRNVTAVGGVRGVVISGEDGDTGHNAATVHGTNVIARGASAAQDAVIENHNNCGSPCDPGVGSFTFSNLRSAAAGTLTLGAGIQTGDPLFVSPTDLHLRAGSPAIGAGSSTGIDSTLDFEGQPRVMGGKIDIGADEFFVAPRPAPVVHPPVVQTPAVPGDTTRPRITKIRLGRRTIVFTSSEAARVRVKVERRTIGRRRGKRCVRRTRRNRHRKHCIRYARVGTKTFNVRLGKTTRSFKFRRKALKRGRYRLTFSSTDKAGNKSTRRVKVRKRR
jgi:hypothetical protein